MMTKRKRAAALQYEKSYDAPIVTASGLGLIADNIVEAAKENNVPIVENEELANLLTNVDVGSFIPVELYEAVAHIIAYVTDLDKVIDSR